MRGRIFCDLREISKRMAHSDIADDWVTIGVVFHTIPHQKSKNGQTYCCIDISDLSGETVRVFAFDDACTTHKSIPAGSVIAILNPKVLPPSEVCIN